MRSLFPVIRREDRDPFESLQNEMNRMFGRFGIPVAIGEARFPALDVTEAADAVEISAELPGVSRDDVSIELTRSGLVIRGEKKREEERKEEGAYLLERSYGSFVRTVPLPFEAEPDRVEAKFKDGVLKIRVPKPEEAKAAPKTIHIAEG